MIRYHASWILPISEPPIRDGWVAVDRGRIVARARQAAAVIRRRAGVVDLGDVAVLPGLVNAHTHLELSYLRDEVPPAASFVTWVGTSSAARRERPEPRAGNSRRGRSRARHGRPGTALVGDISNTLVTFALLP